MSNDPKTLIPYSKCAHASGLVYLKLTWGQLGHVPISNFDPKSHFLIN